MLLDTHKDEIETIVARYASKRSAVLPLLYIAQDSYGHLTGDAIREVADILGLPPTDVFEVVGFYTLYYSRPVGAWVLQVCDDVPCCYLGAEELVDALKRSLGIAEEQTTPDGLFTLQRVKCLAACDRAPVLQANLDYVYDVTPERVDALLADLRARADEAKRRGASGRFAEDFEFDGAGRPVQIERAGPYRGRWSPAPAATREPSAPAPAAEAPTQPAPDRSNAGVMPRPEADAGAVPAHAAQQAAPQEVSQSEAVEQGPPAPPSATGQPEPILDRPADKKDQEQQPAPPRRRSPL